MDVQIIVEAIALRDAVKAGRMSRKDISRRVMREYVAGNWAPSQIAAIVGYTPQGVGYIIRGSVRRGETPAGGTLNADCLDLVLALHGAHTDDQRRNLLDACIRTGTSTRLIARMTGRPLSTITYRKTRMKEQP